MFDGAIHRIIEGDGGCAIHAVVMGKGTRFSCFTDILKRISCGIRSSTIWPPDSQ